MAPLALKHIFESIGVNRGGDDVTVTMSALAMHENGALLGSDLSPTGPDGDLDG